LTVIKAIIIILYLSLELLNKGGCAQCYRSCILGVRAMWWILDSWMSFCVNVHLCRLWIAGCGVNSMPNASSRVAQAASLFQSLNHDDDDCFYYNK